MARTEGTRDGIILMVLGLVFLLGQITGFGWLVLPLLAVGFLGLGVVHKEAGWFIPGGILAGVSLGVFLTGGPFTLEDGAEGGAFMIAFALGWFSITLLTRLFTQETHWWALIPGGIMLLVGFTALGWTPGEQLLRLLGYAWPLALLGLGLYLLLRERQSSTDTPPEERS